MPRKSPRAFTLIEMILVVAIMTLVAGAISGILQGSITAATALTETEQRQGQVQSFFNLLDTSFRNMGGETIFMAQKNPIVDQSNIFLMFNRAPHLFAWHRDQTRYPAKILTWWPNEKGLLTIGLLEYNRLFKLYSGTKPLTDFSAADWKYKVPLLAEIKEIKWRFWQEKTKKWTDEWRNPSEHPSGIELTIQLAESTEPITHFFWLPTVQIQPLTLSSGSP